MEVIEAIEVVEAGEVIDSAEDPNARDITVCKVQADLDFLRPKRLLRSLRPLRF